MNHVLNRVAQANGHPAGGAELCTAPELPLTDIAAILRRSIAGTFYRS